MLKKIALATTALVSTLSLTGCNPPMPPDVLAILAEQNYTCEMGDVSIKLPAELADLGYGWSEALTEACPEMALSIAEESANLEVGSGEEFSKECTPYARVPFAIDAAVLAFSLDGIDPLNLSAVVVGGILTGAITTWDDPQIAQLNPDLLMPAQEIVVYPYAPKVAIDALSGWLMDATGSAPSALLVSSDQAPEEPIDFYVPGQIYLTTLSKAAYEYLPMASLVDPKDFEGTLAFPDIMTVASSASQLETSESEGVISVKRNPALEVVASEGFDVAGNPYPAIFTMDLALCGADSLVSRAAARFMLRLDQQGALGASPVIQLPEAVRIQGLALVSKGLPEPEIPEDFGQ